MSPETHSLPGGDLMPKYYTPEEVAQELRVTRRTVYEWLTSGRLRGMRAGNRWRVDVEL
jgi:excisionase family DNA binding protein